MRGIKLTINGKDVCVAAVPELHQLQSTILMSGTSQPQIEVTGYINRQADVSEHLTWGRQYLKIGDKISVELIDTDNPDKPLETATISSSFNPEEFQERIAEQLARMRLEIETFGKEAVFGNLKGKYCSFCGKDQTEVKQLISGPGVFICDECVAICNDILSGKHKRPPNRQWPEKDA